MASSPHPPGSPAGPGDRLSPGAVGTVGHGALPSAVFVGLLGRAGVTRVVDVRSVPGSRRHPQFGGDELALDLPAAGIAYTWAPRLGGRRRGRPDSVHLALGDGALRGYADHMASEEFRAGLDELVELAAQDRVAVLCAESLWWRCHRQLLADALTVLRAGRVEHLFHDGRLQPHVPTPTARRVDDVLVYDIGATPSLW